MRPIIASLWVEGSIRVEDSHYVHFQRLHFTRAVTLSNSEGVEFLNSQFTASGVGLEASSVQKLKIGHSLFTGFDRAAISLQEARGTHLVGNLFDNLRGAGLYTDDASAVSYADYNTYRRAAAAWQIDQGSCSLDDTRMHYERYSSERSPEIVVVEGSAQLLNSLDFVTAGPLRRATGPYHDKIPERKMELIEGPTVHSVSATTANVEWFSSLPATAVIEWGETQDLDESVEFDMDRFGSYSLRNLEPNRTYFLRIKSLRVPTRVEVQAEPFEESSEIITFTTLASDPDPVAYYVSPTGDDTHSGLNPDNAFRTIQRAANQVSVGDRPMIRGTHTRWANEPATIRNNVYTDSLSVKADANVSLFYADGGRAGVKFINNNFHLRTFGPEERYMLGTSTAYDLPNIFVDPLFVDPLFAGSLGLTNTFVHDGLMRVSLELDFPSFFATHPEVVSRGMGLEPERFGANGAPN